MGYDLHITRRAHWAEEEDGNSISLQEWLTYIGSDDELKLKDGYLVKTPGAENAFHNVPGFCNWSGHSVMKGDSQPWFDYRDGVISTKNPDEEIIRKMINIAAILNAVVKGDDGELYDENYFSNQHNVSALKQTNLKKSWWKFW